MPGNSDRRRYFKGDLSTTPFRSSSSSFSLSFHLARSLAGITTLQTALLKGQNSISAPPKAGRAPLKKDPKVWHRWTPVEVEWLSGCLDLVVRQKMFKIIRKAFSKNGYGQFAVTQKPPKETCFLHVWQLNLLSFVIGLETLQLHKWGVGKSSLPPFIRIRRCNVWDWPKSNRINNVTELISNRAWKLAPTLAWKWHFPMKFGWMYNNLLPLGPGNPESRTNNVS